MKNDKPPTHSYLIFSGSEASRMQRAGELGLSCLFGEGTDEPSRPFLSHPDVLIIEPDPESKSATITINQIRDLERRISLKPYSADSKVVVIKEAQKMTKAAQNALLKTLEEPPGHSVLILTVSQPNLLLPTIISRCQRIVLRPEFEVDVGTEAHRTALKDFLRFFEAGCGERLSWVEENRSLVGSPSQKLVGLWPKQSVIGLLDSWISALRDLLLVEEGLGGQILNQDFRKEFEKVDVSNGTLPTLLGELIEVRQAVSTTNINPRLAIEAFLIEL